MRLTRTAGACVAGLALGIVPLTAGPALAAGGTTSLTQASCTAGGGTYTFVKGLKTCTTVSPIEPVDEGGYPSAAFVNDSYGQWLATWTMTETQQVTMTQTEKGKGPISTNYTNTIVSRTVDPASRTCTLSTSTPPYEVSEPVTECESRNLYPPNI